jgi:NTP pyrophosphatase (non-canonical NTP hydrolase)
MMTIRQFLLAKLAEECAEVAQRAMKQQQFGPDEIQEGQDFMNRERLLNEFVDLLAVAEFLLEINEIPSEVNLDLLIEQKRAKVNKYLKLSQELGQVEEGTI